MEPVEIKVSDVVFREDLYPRIDRDPAMVQKYAGNLDVLPPIEVNQHNELIDGWHRWTAHATNELETIQVIVTETKSDAEFLALACRRNASAGKQLSNKDKHSMAVRLYNGGQGIDKKEIREILSVTEQTVTGWLHDIDAQIKKERDAKIFDMWMTCHTQQEIADAVKEPRRTIADHVEDLAKMKESSKSPKLANFADDAWSPQLYSVWNFPKATNEVKHFGNIPPEIIENLLYYYTKPFDVVFDPFGGGGSTIDICKKRLRRYWVSDLTPIEARKHEIREHDITTGVPKITPVPDFVFLDPPYWKQAEGKYSDKKTDLGNVEIDTFLDTIGEIAKQMKTKWKTKTGGGKLALIIGMHNKDDEFHDLAFRCYERIKMPLISRIIVPYSTQVYGGAHVERAKENKEFLYMHRDLMVFGV